MKYFLHDANAFQDEKITELFINYGYEGIGLFFTILERLAAQEKPIKTAVLKKQLMVGKKLEKTWAFMEEIGLISSENGETFNEKLLKYSQNYKIKKEKTRERVAKHRDNEDDTENVTRYNGVRNAAKVNRNKVNKDTNVSSTPKTAEFDGFWDHYGKKTGSKQVALREWNKLSEDDRLAAYEAVDRYKAYQPDAQFRKDPERYLKHRVWESEFDVLPTTAGQMSSPIALSTNRPQTNSSPKALAALS